MSSKRPVGYCHLCLKHGPLSFEHTPPRAAFNNRPVLLAKYEDVINSLPGEQVRGRVQQRGAGAYVLCGPCNWFTGHQYVPSFLGWCEQGMNILLRARGEPLLRYPIWLRPLETLKQIVTMFLATNAPTFGLANPELLRFVRNPRAKGLPRQYRFFTYYMGDGYPRFFAVTIGLNYVAERLQAISEISFPPFGYLMTIDSDVPDRRLCEITHFAQSSPGALGPMTLDLVALPIIARLPGDYRPREEVVRTIEGNRARRASDPTETEYQPPPLAERIVPMMEKAVQIYGRITGQRQDDRK